MKLQNHLKQHHTVRLSDGVEVEKPKDYGRNKGALDGVSLAEIDQYNRATPVIKLPNWMEFWEALDSSFDYHDSEIVRNIQSEFKLRLSKPPRIEEFVAVGENGEVLEEPNQYIGALEFGEGEDYEKAIEYQTALDNVIYEGWKVSAYTSRMTTIDSPNSMISFIDGVARDFKTTDDLNRHVQLYMKIK